MCTRASVSTSVKWSYTYLNELEGAIEYLRVEGHSYQGLAYGGCPRMFAD